MQKKKENFKVLDKRRNQTHSESLRIETESGQNSFLVHNQEETNKALNLLAKQAQAQNYIVPIKPFGSRILVRNDETSDSVGLIHVPENAKRRNTTGIIIGVGDLVIPSLKEGMRVLFGLYDGTVVEYKRKKNLTILDQANVRAIIEGSLSGEEIEIGA